MGEIPSQAAPALSPSLWRERGQSVWPGVGVAAEESAQHASLPGPRSRLRHAPLCARNLLGLSSGSGLKLEPCAALTEAGIPVGRALVSRRNTRYLGLSYRRRAAAVRARYPGPGECILFRDGLVQLGVLTPIEVDLELRTRLSPPPSVRA